MAAVGNFKGDDKFKIQLWLGLSPSRSESVSAHLLKSNQSQGMCAPFNYNKRVVKNIAQDKEEEFHQHHHQIANNHHK